MTDLEKKIRNIVERVYEDGSFEGGHRDIQPDRIKPALIAILAIIEEEKDNCPRCDWFDSLVQSKIRDKYDSLPAYCVAMEKKIAELHVENGQLREALEKIAVPVRSDGTYNRCREACEQIAKQALNKEE